MGLEGLSTFQKFLAIGKWAGLASLLLLVVVNLSSVIVLGLKTNDWNPLIDATLGKLIASDNDIRYATEQLMANPNLPSLYVNTLKESIIYSLGFIFLIHYLVYLGLKSLFTFSTSQNALSPFSMVIILFVTILLVIAGQLVYNGVIRDSWNWMPYQGVISLIKNYTVFSVTGDTNWTLANGVPEFLNMTNG